jgi:hypothetical protein
MKHISALAFWQHSNTEAQFRKADSREVQRFDDLRVNLGKYVHVACRF